MKRFLFLLLFSSVLPAAENPIRPEAIEGHVRFLADDLLEGREAGSRGHAIAARYVAAQFRLAGLVPAGDGGTYFQRVPLRAARLIPAESSFAILDGATRTAFAHRQHILISPHRLRDRTSVEAPVVFVGYGVVAPELQHDDYAGVDVKGKLVLVVSGAPASFPNNPRAYYSSSIVKQQTAVDHGAVGMLTVRSPSDEKRTPFAKAFAAPDEAAMSYVDPNGRAPSVVPEIETSVRIDESVAAKLFAHAPATLAATLADVERGEHRSFPLRIRVAAKTASRSTNILSENVVARLDGSDPARRAEHLVYSAHLDHLGISSAPKGDRIFNGALDNGSGIACLIEIARAFAAMPGRPARSILFVALTAEEKGEQGAAAFVDRPPVPREQLVADINMDMFMMLYPVADLVLLGSEQTTLGEAAARAASAAGFVVSPDPQPEEVRFVRSDQYAFVRKGIPAIHLKAGLRSSDPSIDSAKIAKEWLRDVYHSPRDEVTSQIDWPSGASYAYANLLLGLEIANAPERPKWKAGDFFAARFVH